MIRLDNVCKTYFQNQVATPVLKNITLEIKAKEFIAIMGASGSGKSTLLNLLGLLDPPTSGDYYLFDEKVSSLDDDTLANIRNMRMGFVFQSFYLLPILTAEKNIELPLMYTGCDIDERERLVTAALDKVGIQELAKRKPNAMSGGQQQRVAIARAMVNNPEIIFADEPTGALDSKTGQQIMDLLLRLNKEENKTIVMVTHDPNIGKQCQRLIQIKDGVVVND
jgi:putative ABC transport system ATP-binding protein